MKPRLLVTYATRAGSTREVAAIIGDGLTQRGFAVDVTSVKANPHVEDYQAILIGSAVRMGQWLPEAVEWIKTNQQALQRGPVALFTVHMHNTGDDAQSRANREAYLSAIRPLLHPVDAVFFSGKIDPTHLSLLERLLVRAVKASVGDARDWDSIGDWAQTVPV
jgi:menaquinone-dependent protoporphyrinogen oxidase